MGGNILFVVSGLGWLMIGHIGVTASSSWPSFAWYQTNFLVSKLIDLCLCLASRLIFHVW